MFGFQRRRVFTCECETLFPKLGPLPQMSHVDATAVLLTKLVTPDRGGDEQGERVSRPGREAPIRGEGALRSSLVSVKCVFSPQY